MSAGKGDADMGKIARQISDDASKAKDVKAKAGCCGLFSGKTKEKPFNQTLVVLRHSERLDQVDKKAWEEHEMSKEYPFDGPLTTAGVQLAAKVALELQQLHQEVNFAAIACSPYLRCMETAAEVAKLTGLPVMLDQEIAEVWEAKMPSTHLPHRPPKELKVLAASLGLKVVNPIEDDGVKLFGKIPLKHPENLEAGHRRFLVRIENYLTLSTSTRQNFIIVGHAPAVSAMLLIFERGHADVEKTEYCARVIARRKVVAEAKENEHGVYAAHWNVESKDVVVTIDKPVESYMVKTMENMHMDLVEETNDMVVARRERRTKTDKLFEGTIAAISKGVPEEDEDKV